MSLLDPPPYRPPFKLSSTGLTLSVGTGNISGGNGKSIAVAAGSVFLQASKTNYIMVDLFDLSLHCFNRPWHSAAVCIATVVTNATAVTSALPSGTYGVPPNGIASANARLRFGGNTVRFTLYGDSYAYGAGDPVGGFYYWFDLIWNSAAAAYGYNLANVANAPLLRYGAPGQTAIWGMAMIADTCTSMDNPGSFARDNVDQVAVRYPHWNAQLITPDPYVGPNAVIASTPDVVVIELGTNDNAKNVEWLEAQVRFWRFKRVQTIFVSPITAYNGSGTATATDSRLKEIADSVGCPFADANAFMDEAYYNFLHNGGPNPYASDLVHPSITGQPLVARSITGLFNPYFQHQTNVQPPERPIATSTIRSSPHAHITVNHTLTGGTGTGTTLTPAVNLRVLMGGQLSTDGFVTITGSQYVIGNFDLVSGDVYAIFENQAGQDFSWSVTQQATPISSGNVTGNNIPFQMVRIISAATVQSWPAANSTYASGYNMGMPVPVGFRLNCTAGTAKFVGFLYESPYITSIPLNLITTSSGVWAYEITDQENISPTPIVLGSDTLNCKAIISANDCDGISVLLRAGPKAGKIRFTTDGLAPFSNFDLYSANDLLYYFATIPGCWQNYAGVTPGVKPTTNYRGDHYMQLTYTGSNASVVAGTVGVRRLTFEQVKKFKMQLP